MTLDGLRRVFADAPPGVMPCYPLLEDQSRRGAIRGTLDGTIEARLVPRLLEDIPPERTAAILQFLTDRHAAAVATEQSDLFGWYVRYLEAAVRCSAFDAILPEIPLLSQADRWESAAKLTTAAVGVQPGSLLAHKLAEIISKHVHLAGSPTPPSPDGEGIDPRECDPGLLEDEIRRAIDALGEYAEEWAALPEVPRELVGGFLALLGDDPVMVSLAELPGQRPSRRPPREARVGDRWATLHRQGHHLRWHDPRHP